MFDSLAKTKLTMSTWSLLILISSCQAVSVPFFFSGHETTELFSLIRIPLFYV